MAFRFRGSGVALLPQWLQYTALEDGNVNSPAATRLSFSFRQGIYAVYPTCPPCIDKSTRIY